MLAWTGPDALQERDYEQIALQLTGHARAVAADVRRRADQLPADSTVRCVQNRARLVRALYERLDRLTVA